MDFEPGSRFGRYTIERVLGEGGMGRVYLATDTSLLRRVALKLLLGGPADGTDQQSLAEKLLTEARVAAAINHENVIAVLDVGVVDGIPFMAMEYVAGESLRAKVGRTDILMVSREGWLRDAARGLQAAHDKGLVHHDVKPENVFVRKDGRAKVLDFGIAHKQPTVIRPDGTTIPLEMLRAVPDGTNAGTPRYMSPEQLKGEPVDARCDQFAWGAMAYELLTGTHPFPAEEWIALITEIIASTPPAFARDLDLSPTKERIVMRALSKNPVDRFPSMRELVEAWDADAPRSGALPINVTGEPVLVPAPSPPNRRRWMVAAVMSVVLGAVFAVGAAAYRTTRASYVAAVTVPTDASALNEGMPLTSIPLPESKSREALAEYSAGIQAARDGAGSAARSHFAKASELDRMMASADLMFAALTQFQDRAAARGALDRTRQHRASLTKRELALLASIEPVLDVDPPNLQKSEKTLLAATSEFPSDAQLRLQLSLVRFAEENPLALDDAKAALGLDPEFAAARVVEALIYESRGDEVSAQKTYEDCERALPTAASCVAGRVKLLSRDGKCAEALEEATGWKNRIGSDAEGLRTFAVALAGSGRPLAEIRAALEASREKLPDNGTRRRRELSDQLALALLNGSLVEARALADKLFEAASAAQAIGECSEAVKARLDIEDELGRPKEAARMAAAFLDRQVLWSQATRLEQDPTPRLVSRARRGGLLTEADADASMKRWRERWTMRGKGERWLAEYPVGVETKEEAEGALRAQPTEHPLPLTNGIRASLDLGRTYLLAGRIEPAIFALRRASNDCGILRDPTGHAHAIEWLGEALGRNGDVPNACSALKRVRERLGAQPGRKSSTLLAAESAARKYRCH